MSSKNTERISLHPGRINWNILIFLEVQLKSFCEFFQLGTTPENRKKEGLSGFYRELPNN